MVWLGFGLVVVGFGVVVYYLVRGFRSGAIRLRRSSPLDRMEPEERRRALRQIRGRAPVSPHEAADLRIVAEQLAAQRPILGLAAGMFLIEVGQLLMRWSAFGTGASIVLTLVIVAGATLVYRDVRLGRRFLRRWD